jgi:hypothetical protein
MTDQKQAGDIDDDLVESERNSDPLGGLLGRALSDVPVPQGSLLPGIQHRIRVRTKGRYFRDRWNVVRNPVTLLLMTALLVLVLAAAIFLVMEALLSEPEEQPSGPEMAPSSGSEPAE